MGVRSARCYDRPMKDKPLSPELDKIELEPDAWERTERAIKTAVQRPPPQQAKPQPAQKPSIVKQPRKR